MAPVGDGLRNKIAVGHDHGDVVIGHHRCASQTDFFYAPGDTTHLNAVTNGDRVLGINDDAAYKIIDHIL